MSEGNWKPLGIVINRVLADAQQTAIRKGRLGSRLPVMAQDAAKVNPGTVRMEQLVLPFDIAVKRPQAAFGQAKAPRGIRLT